MFAAALRSAHEAELLRLKGNFLWPAMWGKSIAEDDPESLALAARMGVVLGTSHHEPLTRALVDSGFVIFGADVFRRTSTEFLADRTGPVDAPA